MQYNEFTNSSLRYLMRETSSSSISNFSDFCSLLRSGGISGRLLDDLCRVTRHNSVRCDILDVYEHTRQHLNAQEIA